MAFGRGDVNSVLDSLGVEIPADVRDSAVTKLMQLHGTTIAGMRDRLNEYDKVDIDGLKKDSETLKGIQGKLGTISVDAAVSTYNTVTEKLGGRNLEEVIAENEKYALEAEGAKKTAAVTALLANTKFTGKTAEEFIREKLSALELDKSGALKNGEATLKELQEKYSDAFVVVNNANAAKPRFSAENKSNVATNTMTEQQAYLERLKKRI